MSFDAGELESAISSVIFEIIEREKSVSKAASQVGGKSCVYYEYFVVTLFVTLYIDFVLLLSLWLGVSVCLFVPLLFFFNFYFKWAIF